MPITPDDAGTLKETEKTSYIEDETADSRLENQYPEIDGEDLGVEFPSVPEITQMGNDAPSLVESALPNMMALLKSVFKNF